jgi:Ca2+-binding RTX toxin-like protein
VDPSGQRVGRRGGSVEESRSHSVPGKKRRGRACAAGLALVLVGVLAFAIPAAAFPPTANPDMATTAEDTAVDIHVLANDTDQDGDPLFITAFTQGTNGTVTDGTPFDDALRYTPASSFTGQDTFMYTIDDDPSTPADESTATVTVDVEPSMTIGDVTLTEGNTGATNATFQVTISSADPSAPVTVNFATADGTALTGTDYQATSGTLTIPATTTSGEIVVPVVGDTLDEPDEGFVVNLSMPTGAVLQDAQGAGTITDDDLEPALAVNDIITIEGNVGTTAVEFRVALNAASGKSVAVGVTTANGTAQAPNDYQSVSGPLAFAPGETLKSVFVNVVGDTTFEPDESFVLNLSSPVNATIADGQGVAMIQNNDASPGGCDITGTMGADTIVGTDASERICGLGGNDTISGGGGDDEILGDAGNDRIDGGPGADAIEGGRGNDRLVGGAGGDSLEGGSGLDVLDGGAGDDNINGEGGRDVARGGAGDDVMDAGAGNDSFVGGGDSDRIDGAAGNDRVLGDGGNDFVDGGAGNDAVHGNAGNDRVRGLAGADLVTGSSGNDQISGGGGVDHVVFASRVTVDLSRARATGEGRDRVFTVEVVTGSGAGDTLIGNSAPNTLNGGGGRDRIFGRGGDDRLNGGGGNDVLRGQAGRDVLVGGSGNDTCDVGPGGGVARSC